MIKKHKNLTKVILDKAFDGAKKSFDFPIEFKNGEDSVSVNFEDYFEDTFARIQLLGNGSANKGFASAEAFALNAFNIVAHTRELHKQIDDYFSNDVNKPLLDTFGMTEEEKSEYRKQLKEMVSETIGFKGNTPEENAFIEKINAVFDMGNEAGNPDLLKETLGYLSNVSRYIENGASQKDALDAAFNDASFLGGNIDVATVLSSEISTFADTLGKNEKLTESVMQDVTKNYVDDIDSKEVTPESFSWSYQTHPNNLSNDEKAWAQKAFGRVLFNTMDMENGWDVFNIDLTNFRANGEQIVSDEEFRNAMDKNGGINPEKQAALQAKIVAKMAEGAEISVINRTPEKSVNINTAEIKPKTPAEKFLFNYPDSLTADDKQWAQDVTANLINYNGGMVEVNRFYADGEQIIPDTKNLSFEQCSQMIAQKIASGAQMGVRLSAFNQKLELMTMDAQDMAAINPQKEPVTPESFKAHYQADPNNLTPEEKQWASEAYDKMFYGSMDLAGGWGPQNVNISAFRANGQQIISPEELAKTGPKDVINLKAKIAFSLASGDKISVRREVEEKSVSFDLSSVKLNMEASKEQAEPAKTEPAKTEPAKTEPAKTEPAKTEPAKTEPAKTQPVKKAPAKIPAKNVNPKNINARKIRFKKQAIQRQRIAANRMKVQNAVNRAKMNAQRSAQNNPAKITINQKPTCIENFIRRLLINLVKGFFGIDLNEILNKQKAAENTAPTRTKMNFSELSGTNSKANKTNKPTERTQDKNLSKNGRTM